MGSLWQTINRASGHQSGTYDGEALNAFSGLDDSEAIWYAFVHFGICLHSFIMVRYQRKRVCEEKSDCPKTAEEGTKYLPVYGT